MGKIIKRILATIGKPIYFIFVALFTSPFWIINKVSSNKTKVKRKKRISKISTKKHGWSIKLEELRLKLFLVKVSGILKKRKRYKNRRFYPKNKPIIFVLFITIAIGLTFYLLIIKGIPSPYDLGSREPNVSTKIYDRNGVLLYKIYKDENRTILPLNQIPESVKLATLAAEDAEFYSHPGFSVKGIFRALVQDIKTGKIHGGSTITQQLVKNTLLSPEKTIIRKVREIILSVQIETIYTKDQILEMYLNEVSYGGTAYGIEEASESYFGKSVGNLNLAESAMLAGLPKSPTTFSPFGSHPELAFDRQREVLRLMVINKYISEEEFVKASEEKLHFVSKKTEIKAPHFVMYVRQILADKYGEETLENGGLEVVTSLDLNIQEIADKVVKSEVSKLTDLHVGNGAALVINPQTGEILAMVGSKDYFDIENDGNVNVLTSQRQPGSSIKVVNYAFALGNGFTPASIINDSPITYNMPGAAPYSPVNYDGKFVGNVTLRSALAESRNIPAVKVLASYGVSKMIDQGKLMGITTWGDTKNYGLSLTLGGGAVKATDLAKVYATLANSGKTPDLMPILQVKNYKGQILENNEPKVNQSIDQRISFLLTDILKDNNARSRAFGYNSYLVVKDHPEVAVKTGTSNDLRDNWAIGYNQNYLVLTWVGNNDNSPMSRVASGVTGASPIWNKIITNILNGQPSIDWNAPLGVSKINICTYTGTLPCEGCPTKQEWFLDENKPSKHCVPEQGTDTTKVINNNILDTGVNTTFNR